MHQGRVNGVEVFFHANRGQGEGCLAGGPPAFVLFSPETDQRYLDFAVMFLVSVVVMPSPMILITMFQIHCHHIYVCHCLRAGERRQGGVLILNVQDAGQLELCG